MRFFVLALALSMAAPAYATRDLTQAFRFPLILGASVSSGLKTKSPGDRAAERFPSRVGIKNIAGNGRTGVSFREQLTEEFFRPHSIIIGVDFLFWDSVKSDPQQAAAALDKLILSARANRLPLLLGDIPALFKSLQRHRDFLNQQIHAKCKMEEECFVLPFDGLHQEASTVGIVIDGKRYFYKDLTVDGLHLNAIGAEHGANLLLRILE